MNYDLECDERTIRTATDTIETIKFHYPILAKKGVNLDTLIEFAIQRAVEDFQNDKGGFANDIESYLYSIGK